MIYGPNIILHGASEDSGQSPPPPGSPRNLFWRVPLEFRNGSVTNELCYSFLTVAYSYPQIVSMPVQTMLGKTYTQKKVHRRLKRHQDAFNTCLLSNFILKARKTYPDSDSTAPGEAEVLVALPVLVSDDRLPHVLGQGHAGAHQGVREARTRAHLNCKLGWNKKIKS